MGTNQIVNFFIFYNSVICAVVFSVGLYNLFSDKEPLINGFILGGSMGMLTSVSYISVNSEFLIINGIFQLCLSVGGFMGSMAADDFIFCSILLGHGAINTLCIVFLDDENLRELQAPAAVYIGEEVDNYTSLEEGEQ
jgi:hypothetical protein